MAPRRVLPALVLAQLAGTSPWFAANAVMPELQREHGWDAAAIGTLTSALQMGFIAGTLVFAVMAVSDRYPARRVLMLSAWAAAACTLAAAYGPGDLPVWIFWRAATGFCLAGIYPVGMKLATQWFPNGLGHALGWLVGALVVGSASPHAVRALAVLGDGAVDARLVMACVAGLSAAAGVGLMLAVPEPPRPGRRSGPVLPDAGRGNAHGAALSSLWHDARLRGSVGGYFGHMWELYTLWVLVPAIVATRIADPASISAASFTVLAVGAVGCIGGGYVARRLGSVPVAGVLLGCSGLCCVAAPWALAAPFPVFAAWLLLWGVSAAGDSPQFSALTAANAPRAAVGSVLTLVNSLGFAISVVSIELFVRLSQTVPLASLLPWLAAGPAIGLLMLRPLWRAR